MVSEKSPSLLKHKLLSVLHSGNRGVGSMELKPLLDILISAVLAGILVLGQVCSGDLLVLLCS